MHVDQDWLAARMLERPRWHLPVVGYRCSEHPERMAQDRCDRRGRPFCHACLHHLARWRVCLPCRGALWRERELQTLPRRLRRGRSEIVAAIVILLVFIGTYALIQHLLGAAGSDAGLARAARGLSGAPPGQQVTAQPGRPALRLEDLHALGGHTSEQLRTGVQGRNFRPGEAVQVVLTWRGSRTGGPVVTKAVGPLSAKADADGTFSVHTDFGSALPALPNMILEVNAKGAEGSHATLSTVLGHE